MRVKPGKKIGTGQASLFSIGKQQNDWTEEWVGMPEFVQDDLGPLFTVKVHFRSMGDLQDFEKLLGQKVNRYMVLWHPKAERRIASDKRYVDEP